MKLIKRIFWRLQFKKVKFEGDTWMKGRCIDCAAGNPKLSVQIITALANLTNS